MKKLSEGKKMFLSVMAIFIVYSITFLAFDDYDRRKIEPMYKQVDWNLLLFSLLILVLLAILLYRYARRMDARIKDEQNEMQSQMRRRMTENIAHELKTPVSGILGYMETILENPDVTEEMKHQFIVRSYGQAKRLKALLQDISMLTRMTDASEMFEIEDVNVSRIVADLSQDMEQGLSARNMTFINNLPAGIVINGNRQLLESIFWNLFDNAMKYAGENTTIRLSATERNDRWHFTFSDNGMGISEEHFERIFERFYRVDKGRSRQMGGTGLGLSIVKNAVQFHGGTISAHHNADEKGLCLEFTIKK